MGLSLEGVEAFAQVVELGSFTAAARALGVPKSTVSRAVSKLERELRTVLLLRTTRKVAVTEAGQFFLERARSALALLSDARAQLGEGEKEPRGLVRFTAPIDPGGTLLGEALHAFSRRHPEIHVECMLTQRRVDMVAEGVDLALRAGVVDDASLSGKRLGESRAALFAAPSFLAAHGRPKRVADLARFTCLPYRSTRGRTRWHLTGPDGDETVEVRGGLAADELSLLRDLAVRGAGIVMLPTLGTEALLEDGRLERVLPRVHTPGGAVYLVHPAAAHVPRRVVLLRDHLYRALKPMFRAP